MLQVINKIKTKYNKLKFDKAARRIRSTAPVDFKLNKEVVIVSQVYHNAVDMTLVALKSFLIHFGQGFVELLDDGSLTPEDYQLFKRHIPHLNITHINDINLGNCPKGGCWERLVHIVELSKHSYVIQVDTDTITVGPLIELFDHFKANQACTIGSPAWSSPIDVNYLATLLSTKNGQNVQIQGEIALAQSQAIKLEKYCRGCAAFTGFPMGVLNFKDLEGFSMEMELALGKSKWHEWGSEQFASNVLISSCDNSVLLPWPKYQNYGFPRFTEKQKFHDFYGKVSVLHFIGSNRFVDSTYCQLTKKLISELD